MKTKNLIWLLFAITLSGCKIDNGNEMTFLRSYIVHYNDYPIYFRVMEENSKFIFDGEVGLFMPDCKAISIYTEPISYLCDAEGNMYGSYYYNSKINREKYDELCRKHNDMTYNREMPNSYISASMGHWASDVESISVISDADYDEQHPSGTSLNDIVIYGAKPAMRYVKSGYNAYTDYPDALVRKPITELEPEDMQLLYENTDVFGGMIALNFPTAPSISKTHNITVTIITDDGLVFSDTVEVSW